MRPSFFDPSKIGTMFAPDLRAAALEGREYAKANGIPASAVDGQKRVILTLIDMQADFINPATSNYPGQLSVPGAVGDVERVCDFIFNNVADLSHIVASLDTHYLFQPFHALNWVAGENCDSKNPGEHPDPFTLISNSDLNNDVWRPARQNLRMREMINRLESNAKKTLCIWPMHCILGTPGHALDPMLMQAIWWHAGARSDQYDLTEKGMSQSSEHYGILEAEVRFDDDVLTHLNKKMVNKWQPADAIYWAGEARTHCCLETLNQAVATFSKTSPEVLERMHVLEDCMSNVPDITDANGRTLVPFDQITTDRFKELANMGVNFVKSTDKIAV